MHPMSASGDALKKLPDEVKFLPALIAWLRTQLTGKETAAAALEKPKHYEQMKTILSATIGEQAFKKPSSVLHSDCLKQVFLLSVQVSSANFATPGFMPYGLGQWFVPVDGSLLIVGVQCQALPGQAFSQKAAAMSEAKADDLATLVKSNGFCMHCKPGMACWAPPGFVCLVITPCASSWLKWSSMTDRPSAEDAETRQVLSSSTMMVSSYPSLFLAYKEWTSYLEVVMKAP